VLPLSFATDSKKDIMDTYNNGCLLLKILKAMIISVISISLLIRHMVMNLL
jgi:hypothetical protein